MLHFVGNTSKTKELLQPAEQPLCLHSVVLISRCQHTAYPLSYADVNDSGIAKITVKDKRSGPWAFALLS